MANQRFGELGLSESGPSNQQPFIYGIHHSSMAPMPSSSQPNFFDQEGSAYFGELEEALLMQGVVGVRPPAASDRKSAAFLAATTATATATATASPGRQHLPTLEIFPSWPMRLQQPLPRQENSHSAETSTDSGSAHTATTMSQHQLESSESPAGSTKAGGSIDQQQRLMEIDVHASNSSNPGGGAADGANQRPQDRRKGTAGGSSTSDKTDPKTLRRLAQNREAARKSRLRKKAYVQQLESSRIRLSQLEQDLHRARSQGLFLGGAAGASGSVSSGAAMFDMEYARWLEDDSRHMTELRGGLQAHLPDGDLRVIVDDCLTHYDDMFRMKGAAAKTDVFHLITGMWASPAERCFLWMGGFRPSEILKMLIAQLDPLTDQQLMGMYGLQHSSQQAEEALTQGYEQLQQSLADTVASGSLSEGGGDVGSYMGQMAIALGKLSNLEGFVRQADNLRQQTLHQLHRILTVRQSARSLLAIGEYHSRLRAVSSLWASRPKENTVIEENICPATSSDLQIVHQPMHGHFSAF